MNCTTMIVEVGTSSDTNVVHVDADGGTKGFMLEDSVAIDEVHHRLKGRWRIGKSEIHDRRFKEAVSGFECRLGLISFADAYVIVSPADVELCINVCVAEVSDEIRDQGKRVLISDREGVNFPVILYRS